MRNVKYLKNGYDANNLREHIALATIIRIPRRVRVNPEFHIRQSVNPIHPSLSHSMREESLFMFFFL